MRHMLIISLEICGLFIQFIRYPIFFAVFPTEIYVLIPICSMYSIFTYIRVIFGANGGKYSIHGAYGIIPGAAQQYISG